MHVFGQRVPDSQASNRQSSTAVGTEPIARDGDLAERRRWQKTTSETGEQ